MTYKEALENVANNWASSVKHNVAVVSTPANNATISNTTADTVNTTIGSSPVPRKGCQKLPGTLARISIPEGTSFNFLNLVEVATPGGICLVVRLPILAALDSEISVNSILTGMMSAIKAAGGTIEILG